MATVSPSASEAEFIALVTEHQRRLKAVAYRLCGDDGLAEDAVSEVFAKVWSRWGTMEIDHPATYLTTAVRNQVIDTFRRLGRERALLQRAFERTDNPDWGTQVEDRQVVDQLLKEIPQHHRQPLVLRYFHGLSEAEIATTLDLPAGTVKSHAHRGIRKLRQMYPAA